MVLLGGCVPAAPATYRFKLTVEVQTPDGVRWGASVYEVKATRLIAVLPDERKRDWSVRGEAVAVDLPNGRTLFALMRTGNPHRPDLALMSLAALDPAFKNDVVESARRIASGRGIRRAAISSADYPLLVTLANNSDPASVKIVGPALEGTLGSGYHLIRITAEVATEPVTRGLEQRLVWLKTQHGALQKIPVIDYPPPGTPLPAGARITERDFRSE